MSKLTRIFGRTLLGSIIIATGITWYSLNMNISSMEKEIKQSKTVSNSIKTSKPKKILYLASPDFETSYKEINKNFKSKLESKYNFYKEAHKIPQKEIQKLEEIIHNFNLDKDLLNNHMGDLNLVKGENDTPFIVRKNPKDCEVQIKVFKNKKEFFNILLDEKIKNLDEIIIFSHGAKSFIYCDEPESFFEVYKIINPNSYITTIDIKNISDKKLGTIRSKLNKNSVIYLLSCNALKNSEKQTTIAEALVYLFQRPVVASKIENAGWPIDVHPYDKIELSNPNTIKEENVSYKANYLSGDWYIIYPVSYSNKLK